MNKSIIFSIIFFLSLSVMSQKSIYDIDINDINGDAINMNDFRGKNLLIVNVASKCGFTYQYEGLEDLYNEYKDKLVVIGVPCNQFGGQEPGSNEQIAAFCKQNYGVSFLITEKVDVSGTNQHPLYSWLCNQQKNGKFNSSVKWNFQKYFVDKNGELVNYFYSITKPNSNKIVSLIK